MDDLISRQAAIDALDEIEAEVADGYGYQYAKWREYFVEMPSAQPEKCTDKRTCRRKWGIAQVVLAVRAATRLACPRIPQIIRRYRSIP